MQRTVFQQGWVSHPCRRMGNLTCKQRGITSCGISTGSSLAGFPGDAVSPCSQRHRLLACASAFFSWQQGLSTMGGRPASPTQSGFALSVDIPLIIKYGSLLQCCWADMTEKRPCSPHGWSPGSAKVWICCFCLRFSTSVFTILLLWAPLKPWQKMPS